MNDEAERVLTKAPLFASLSGSELQALAARTSRKRFQKGELLFAEGDPCTGLFLVASGKIRIFKLSSSGREQVLAVEGPGSSFAELPVFDGGNYQAAASAMENATGGYKAPKDACTTFKALYQGLQEFEEDLHEHVHLENNILFPRAVGLEGAPK